MSAKYAELGLLRNEKWINAALDQKDHRSFILACQEREHLRKVLAVLATPEAQSQDVGA